MITSFHHVFALATLLTAIQAPSLLAQETAAPKNPPMGRHEVSHETLSAEVTAVDLAAREVTLQGPKGNEVTIYVGPAVKRLDEVKAGDFVRVDYQIAVAAEVRKPTAEEAKHPLVLMNTDGRAPEDSSPAGGVARQFKVVTTIEALNRPEQTVTVRGPRGNYLTAQVADPNRLTKVHIGETIVIVYTEGLAISLDKAEKKAGE